MKDKRDEVIEAAKKWLEANTPIRWVTEAVGVEKDIPLEQLNARPQRRAEWLADFALFRETELRRQIADELTEHIERYKTPRAQIASIQANVIEKLRGEK